MHVIMNSLSTPTERPCPPGPMVAVWGAWGRGLNVENDDEETLAVPKKILRHHSTQGRQH